MTNQIEPIPSGDIPKQPVEELQDKDITIECILPTSYPGFDIRVWIAETSYDKDTVAKNREIVAKHLYHLRGATDEYVIARYILSLERVNAVEVTAKIPKGNGIVLYKNWP